MKFENWVQAAVLVGTATAGITVWAMSTFEVKTEVAIRRQMTWDRLDRIEKKQDQFDLKLDRMLEMITNK